MIRSIHANRFWCGLVLIHLSASFIAVNALRIPGGPFVLLSLSWLFICGCHDTVCPPGGRDPGKHGKGGVFPAVLREKRRVLLTALAGVVFTGLVCRTLDSQYEMLITVNAIELAYASWTCRAAGVSMKTYCGIRLPARLSALFLLIPAAVLTYILSEYVNSLSLLVFSAHINSSFLNPSGHVAECVFALALAPAVVEEILFRGLIYGSTGGRWTAVFVSSLCFGLLHLNFNQMCYAFVMGILFGWIVMQTGSLVTTMVIHFLFNSMAILVNVLPDKGLFGRILHFRPGGYGVFLGTGAEDMLWGPAFAGLLVSALCLCLLVGLVKLYKKINPETIPGAKETRDDPDSFTPAAWKPDLWFLAGCGICLLYAVLIEWLG